MTTIYKASTGQLSAPSNLIVSGNVGIGTTLPQGALTITGDIVTTGTVSSGTGMMFRNRVINGDMRINQRGTSTDTASMTAVGTTYGYVADRWCVYRTSLATGMTVAQGTTSTTDLPFTEAGIRYFARNARLSGNTDATKSLLCNYAFESQDSIPLAGKTVTLSFYYRTGANFSGTTLDSSLVYGTGTDESIRGGYTNGANVATKNLTPSTSWVRTSYTGTISSSATQLAIKFVYDPIGTAGANDWFDITGVQLELGSIATPFEYRPYGMELQHCQRYYISYPSSHPIGSGVIYDSAEGLVVVSLPVVMRTTPTYLTGQSGIRLRDGGTIRDGVILAIAASTKTNTIYLTVSRNAGSTTTNAGNGATITSKTADFYLDAELY